MSKNTKCLDCLATFTNSHNLSFCADCGADPQYLVEYETDNTDKLPTQKELLVARIDELIAELNNTKEKLITLSNQVGIDLTNRLAKCGDVCLSNKAPIQSRLDLPYFRHLPDEEFDHYYCGCVGWD